MGTGVTPRHSHREIVTATPFGRYHDYFLAIALEWIVLVGVLTPVDVARLGHRGSFLWSSLTAD